MKLTTAILLGSSFLCTACNMPTALVAGNSSITVARDSFASPSPSPSVSGDPSKQVCDPFGSTEVASTQNGLVGKLYYLSDDQPRYTNVNDMITHGHPVDATLYFNQLNVPTRLFNQGFSTQNGTVLQNQNGNTLYEYFALHFDSEIRLGANDRAGSYEFAVLSDDGSIMKIDEGNGYNVLLNNDGTTPSRLRCATRSIEMTSSTHLPMKLDYFQGPRYEIALMLLWREVDTSSCQGIGEHAVLADQACGQAGNYTFFNPDTTPQQPSDLWIGMLGRGWKVLSADNYFLPATVVGNPCTTGNPNPPVVDPSPTPTPNPSPTTCIGPNCGGGFGT